VRLPSPMLSRPVRLNEIAAHRYGWEVRDGFRATVGLNGELRVRVGVAGT
jgi:hypothetical protein